MFEHSSMRQEVLEMVRQRFAPERFVKPMLLLTLVFYFVFHLLSGERGMLALLKQQNRLESVQSELKLVAGQKDELSRRVKLLSSNSLDLDMLDEQARKQLGYTAPDEVVILK